MVAAVVAVAAVGLRLAQRCIVPGQTCEICGKQGVLVVVSKSNWFICRDCLNQAFDTAEKAATCQTS